MELYIIRHGKTEWNKDKRLQGSVDIPLAEEGRRLAVISSAAMSTITFDRIYSSPLSRAYETACILRGDRKLDIIIDERLRELSFGDAEGRCFPELAGDDSCTFRYFFDRPELYTPVEHGETLEELCKRAASFMQEEILPLEQNCERVLIVAHGAINKALMRFIKQQEIADFWDGGLQRNCGVIRLKLEQQSFTILDENLTFYTKEDVKKIAEAL